MGTGAEREKSLLWDWHTEHSSVDSGDVLLKAIASAFATSGVFLPSASCGGASTRNAVAISVRSTSCDVLHPIWLLEVVE